MSRCCSDVARPTMRLTYLSPKAELSCHGLRALGSSHGKQTELLWGISFGQGTQKLPTPLDLALYLAPSLVQDVELLSVELLHLVQTGVAVLAALTDTDDLATLHGVGAGANSMSLLKP